jgi:nucleotide-binding universal stress UspA family protein
MKWIVGLDLHPSSLGATRFARWLVGHEGEGQGELVGVHVLTDSYVTHTLAYYSLADLTARAERAASSSLRDAGADDVGRVALSRGIDVVRSLEAARVYHHGDALVIGRQAHRTERAFVRLGSMARGVLRNAQGPVIVVPPDLVEPGPGPIVMATSAEADSDLALAFARRLSTLTGRPLRVVHVVPDPDTYLASHYVHADALSRLRDEMAEAGTRRVHTWAAHQKLDPSEVTILRGDTVESLCRFAREEDAALIVTGARRLPLLDRVVLSSISSHLAAYAGCSVAVVPKAVAPER